MSFLGYLILGGVMYISGFMLNLKILMPKRKQGTHYTLTHPTILSFLGVCFVAMLVISALLGKFVLGHQVWDWAFIAVNSLVATVVFYFGLNPDQTQMNIPD